MPQSAGPDPFDWAQLAAWLAGELSPEAAAGFEAWLDADPARAAEAGRLRRLWAAAGQPASGWGTAAALRAVKEAAPVRSLAAARGAQPPRHFALPHSAWWVSLAAALLVLVGGGVAAWWLRGPGAVPAAEPEPMAVLSTPRGQRARLSLPDGSHVLLGPASTLQYSAGDFTTTRELWLDGEAFFEVAHDPARPFRVVSGRGTTEDVGTAFAVSDHAETAFRVVVEEGTVRLRVPATAGEDSVLLSQADVGQVGPEGRLVTRHGVDVASYLAWREGRLVFRNTPLQEVLYRLSIWYDRDIVLGDPALAGRPFTATFEHETPEQVLRVLSVALGVRVEQRGALQLVVAAGGAR